MFFNTSLSNICLLGIYPHSYPKDVSAAYFLHIYLKDVCSGYFHITNLCELLQTGVLCIGLNNYFKDVYTGHLQERVYWVICLHIYFKDVHTRLLYPYIYAKGVSTAYFPENHVLKICTLGILLTHLF